MRYKIVSIKLLVHEHEDGYLDLLRDYRDDGHSGLIQWEGKVEHPSLSKQSAEAIWAAETGEDIILHPPNELQESHYHEYQEEIHR